MIKSSKLNCRVTNNFSSVTTNLLIPPILFLLVFLYFFIYSGRYDYLNEYVGMQKGLFYYLNRNLSQFPTLQNNITQLGDILIFFPLVTYFITCAPKLWKSLLTASLFSLIISAVLKNIFSVPRPAAMLDNESFVIIGETLKGSTSLPSGHSIATFMTITILLFAFMPKEKLHKIIWSFLMISFGLIVAFSRVAVGAHYPIDVIVGSTIGYIVAVLGIIVNNKLHWGAWIESKKYYPIFMLIMTIWTCILIKKIIEEELIIYYFSLLTLILALFVTINVYVKRKKN